MNDMEMLDGESVHELMSHREGLTYSDFNILPGMVDFPVHEVKLDTRITRNIRIKAPLVSSPMDTVTESGMAIVMALYGGMGIIHANFPRIEDQAAEVLKVKRFKQGFVMQPHCLTPDASLWDMLQIKKNYGYTGAPVTETGSVGSKLIGMITSRDFDFIDVDVEVQKQTPVTDIMVDGSRLVLGDISLTMDKAQKILKDNRLGKLPIVNDKGELIALLCRSDLLKARDYPMASYDAKGQLLCGAAVSTRETSKKALQLLVEAGVDVVVIVLVTRAQAKLLIDAGADALRVGMGSGSICITQDGK
ncbi:IMP dehydrogenase / GMP reductase domain protein [Dictyocaulus viviparus]|uniref:IMP dehydrogenase n=1 Tax=Dictyocaulus viviparus TaxID=29172 RepID=A0A0D8XUF0_DICVI|nr:IMP dehydrogenase / GMP reductase domain protein [Dictyocaulus viviparus]